MASLSSLLSSLQNGTKPQAPLPPTQSTLPKSQNNAANKSTVITGDRTGATMKRKLASSESDLARKAPKLQSHGSTQIKHEPSRLVSEKSSNVTPQSNARLKPVSTSSLNNAAKPVARSGVPAQAPQVPQKAATAGGIAAPKKRGFASLMAKAAAAQEAAKASGGETIKHKLTEKLSRREKRQQALEAELAIQQQKQGQGKGTAPSSGKLNGHRPTSKAGPKVTYGGTMKADASTKPAIRQAQKGAGQDKYGGYASWSDLDDAEDDEGSYDSGSDMEGGYDDVMEEELRSARIARREDEEAQAEEERLQREKLERKKRLMALSNSAAAAKKRF